MKMGTWALCIFAVCLFADPSWGKPRWTVDESAYEPNDWDIYDSWPPGDDPAWNGELDPLEPGQNELTGTITSTGWDFSRGWYSGDLDTFLITLPEGARDGTLNVSATFDPDCDNENEIYYDIWVVATQGDWFVPLGCNFSYPTVIPVTCPFEMAATFGLDRYQYPGLLIAGVDGPPTEYTVLIEWVECPDADNDGSTGGVCDRDCDDTDPLVHPCATETQGNGIDEDCTGADRPAHGGIDEIEPNNDPETEAQDLGSIGVGDCIRVYANWCDSGAQDEDHYTFVLATDGKVTTEFDYDGQTYDLGCTAMHATASDPMLLTFPAGDRDGDRGPDVGDYNFTVCIAAADDADGDGFFSLDTCGDDCDDLDPTANPCGFPYETLPPDGNDQDCNLLDWGEVAAVVEESEPNNETAEADRLGELDVYQPAEGEIAWFDPVELVSDGDWFVFDFMEEGLFHITVSNACGADLDFRIGFEWYGEFFLWDADTSADEPVSATIPVFLEWGYTFPFEFYIQIFQKSGPVDGVDYHVELYFEPACLDLDGDGYSVLRADETDFIDWADYDDTECGRDCDDTDEATNPGAMEDDSELNCYDGIDNDCDGYIDYDDDGCQPPHNIALSARPRKGARAIGYLGLSIVSLLFVSVWRRRVEGSDQLHVG